MGEIFQLEVIAVDDCSSDGTLEIMNKYPVSIFSTGKNSGGPNKGRNIALQKATGDYICIADHDDVWKDHRISTLLPYLEKAPVVSSGYTMVDMVRERNIDRVADTAKPFLFYPINETFEARLTKSLTGQNTYLGSLIYRKELKEILFEEHYGMVDFDWVLRLFKDRESIEVCDSLYIRYVDGKNLSLNSTYRMNDFNWSLQSIADYKKEYLNEVKTAWRKIHGSMARYHYLMGDMKKARFYFRRAEFSIKTIVYYLTTFVGSGYVKKKFNIFG
ncbi:MAG: glycosyltransferase family 2 protein [Cyclobacteriaceae bacterium]|nr:glycosyltransferase family 2 protein [Cyclobacteriaceae bacterium]